MKKKLCIGMLITGLIFAFTGTGMAGKSVLEEILDAKTIKVSTDANYAPQSYLNDKGEWDISIGSMTPTVERKHALLFTIPYYSSSALDPELIGEVVEVMERLAKEGMTIIAVTHEMHFARDVADRVLIMEDGVWLEEGPPEEIFSHPKHQRTRQFLAHIL